MADRLAGKRALVLVHEPDGGPGQVAVRLRQRGFAVHTHVVTEDYGEPSAFEPWPAFDDFDLVVLMGSIRSLTDKDGIASWIHREIHDLAAAHKRGQPVFGVCFGGQLITEAMGGSVERAPEPNIGWGSIADGPDGPNPAGSGPWMSWHHDRMIVPDGFDVLAVSDKSVELIRSGKTVGTQFHPEVDVSHLSGWLTAADPQYLDDLGLDPEALLASARENEEASITNCHNFVDWYLDEVAFTE